MLTKIDNIVLIFVKQKAWEMKEKGTSGISYLGALYADKTIIDVKMKKEIFDILKDKELIKGTAIIEISKTTYNEKEKIHYNLQEFIEK